MQGTPDLPVLSEAAAGLSRQLQDQLTAMARQVQPHAKGLTREFDRLLRSQGLGPKQRASLLEITPASAAILLAGGEPLTSFLEQVDYRGRRLAKLGMTPGDVLAALRGFDAVFEALLRDRADASNLRYVKDQLHFCAVLSLNNAFYRVREAESHAFYELYRAEVEAPDLETMLGRFAATLREYTGAGDVRISFFDRDPGPWLRRSRCFTLSRSRPAAMPDPEWRRRYRCFWVVPMLEHGAVRGALQFGFSKEYEWLPREQELLTAAAERCWRAAEKARLIQDLAHREEQIRRLAEHMVQVEEAERRRISRELHDEAGQSLLCVRLQLEMAGQDLPPGLAGVRQRLDDARGQVDHSILEIRRLIAALSPAVLEQMGLAAGLRQLVTRFRSLHPQTEFALHLPRRLDLPPKAGIIVYRLVQECFNNISKYSSASHVNLSVDPADGKLCLHIEDDGVGFDVEKALTRRDCFGLSGLRERVALLGGSLQVRSLVRQAGSDHDRGVIGVSRPGTSIRIELPLAVGSDGPPGGGPAGVRLRERRKENGKARRRPSGRRRPPDRE